jgi:hypothetical protein
MKLPVHNACVEGKECMFWWGSLKERQYLEEPGVDGRIILNVC